MGLKKFWNNVVGKVSGVDEDDIYETDEDFEDDDDEIEDAPRQNQACTFTVQTGALWQQPAARLSEPHR